ncbi:MAG: glycosyltransferase family 4 protein, partial [Armatimonadetes bacterium]|nr:glycosyltransferase family 4 protein [Armatimonadota bacterium]
MRIGFLRFPSICSLEVTFYGEGLHGGGAARVMSVLLNAWAERGETVNLLTMDDGSATPNYTLHPAITHCCLDIERSSSNPIVGLLATYRRVRILRKAILDTKPDVVISFLSRLNVITLLAMKPYNIPVLVSERTDPAQRSIGRVWEYLRNKTY